MMIPITPRPLTRAEQASIARFRPIAGDTPFACLAEDVMLLLSPGEASVDALLREARSLMATHQDGAPGVFVHTLPDGARMVRTVRHLCVLGAPGSDSAALLHRGLAACRRGWVLALLHQEVPAQQPLAA